MRAVLVVLALSGSVHAEPIATAMRARIEPALPAELGIAEIHLSKPLAKLDVDPRALQVELPRVLRLGRTSIKLTVGKRAPVFVPVTLGKLALVAVTTRALASGSVVAAADITIERRAITSPAPAAIATVPGATTTREIAANAAIATTDIVLARPVSRGTQITVEMRRGSVRVRGLATLETAARPGEPASARLAHTRTIVRGTMHAPATLVVEETFR